MLSSRTSFVMQRQLFRALAGRTECRSFVSVTRPLSEKRTIKVPSMGDSITEGTIVEWTAQVGQKVSEDDVVAMVETDKVTLEIKAVVGGVITRHFGAVEETVEVGANLYEIDTDAEPTIESSVDVQAPSNSSIPDTSSAKETQSPPPSQHESKGAQSHRTPSIHFLGKDGWAQLKTGSNKVVEKKEKATKPLSPLVKTGPVDAMYGRPKFSEAEMEALILGGASMAPNVVIHSSGAKFK